MAKGPMFNNLTNIFTTRDSLGIESVAASIAAEICPVVNTVTPRAFYWPFMVWIYYDYHKNSGVTEKNFKTFDHYLKKQDYFFVLSNLLIEDSDQVNMVGKEKTLIDISQNTSGIFECNRDYFITRFGGMQYYNAGLLSMNFIVDFNIETDEVYSFPKLTLEGEKMALAFERKIKDTEYYKNYRLKETPVPKDVLIEYGKIVNIGLNGFEECKNILLKNLFETKRNYKISESRKYLEFLYNEHNIKNMNREICREVFFDYFSPRGEHTKEYDLSLKSIVNDWEIVIGRQYFVAGLEIIWKHMLENLTKPMNITEWVEKCFSNSIFEIDLNNKLINLLNNCNFNYFDREDMIKRGSRNSFSHAKNIEDGLKIILSIYNRFVDRNDFENEQIRYLRNGYESNSISINEMIEKVEEYKEKPIKEFIFYIIDKWLVNQHYITAFNKMLQNRDGFFYERENGIYTKKSDYGMDFQGIRAIQLMQIMKDLDILKESQHGEA